MGSQRRARWLARTAFALGLAAVGLLITVPVRCRIVPGALRVRVPRERPGVAPARQRVDWRRLGALALGRPRTSDAA